MKFISIVILTIAQMICHTAPSCLVDTKSNSLSINSESSPVIHDFDNTPKFHYPTIDSNCIFESGQPRLYLTCPGSNLQYTTKGTSNPGLSTTHLIHTTNSSNKLQVHGLDRDVELDPGSYVSCAKAPTSLMRNVSSITTSSRMNIYSVGFRLNLMDFLPVYEVISLPGDVLWVHAKVLATIERRPKSSESYAFQKGLVYQKKFINFDDISTVAQKKKTLAEIAMNTHWIHKELGGDDNSLIVGQLIFKDDLFYIPQQRSTFYYENTYPIWQSIYEGNWKFIGDVIRKMADETATDLDIYVVPHGGYNTDSMKGTLSTTIKSHDDIYVPEIIAKIVVDQTRESSRGIVFHVANNPYMMTFDMDNVMLKGDDALCTKLLECSDKDFSEALKGLTYCCALEDSQLWQNVKNALPRNLT